MQASAHDTLTVKMPAPLSRRIAAAAKQRRISKSEFLRQAAEQMLRGEAPKPAISVLDALGDLVGCFEGPPDLSTNPKYMEGFGEDGK